MHVQWPPLFEAELILNFLCVSRCQCRLSVNQDLSDIPLLSWNRPVSPPSSAAQHWVFPRPASTASNTASSGGFDCWNGETSNISKGFGGIYKKRASETPAMGVHWTVYGALELSDCTPLYLDTSCDWFTCPQLSSKSHGGATGNHTTADGHNLWSQSLVTTCYSLSCRVNDSEAPSPTSTSSHRKPHTQLQAIKTTRRGNVGLVLQQWRYSESPARLWQFWTRMNFKENQPRQSSKPWQPRLAFPDSSKGS